MRKLLKRKIHKLIVFLLNIIGIGVVVPGTYIGCYCDYGPVCISDHKYSYIYIQGQVIDSNTKEGINKIYADEDELIESDSDGYFEIYTSNADLVGNLRFHDRMWYNHLDYFAATTPYDTDIYQYTCRGDYTYYEDVIYIPDFEKEVIDNEIIEYTDTDILIEMSRITIPTPVYSYNIQGVVLDDETEEPIPGIKVSIGSYSTETDNQGNFTLEFEDNLIFEPYLTCETIDGNAYSKDFLSNSDLITFTGSDFFLENIDLEIKLKTEETI